MPRSNGNYTIRQVNELLSELENKMLDKAHPIHSYFHTDNSAFNPNNEFLGTWIKLDEGVILMSGSSNRITNTNKFYIKNNNIEKITKSTSHSHKLFSNDNYSNTVTGIKRDNTEKCIGTLQDGNKSYVYQNESSGSGNKLVENAGPDVVIGQDGPVNLDLNKIIKSPIVYIWYRTA